MRNLMRSKFYVNFHEIHETENSVYMVIDYLKGGELSKMTKNGSIFSESVVRPFLQNLLTGLMLIHSKGIMHRDLKPENIILRKKNCIEEVSIIDFGLASFVDVKKYLYKRCGTPGYVAPEILSYKDVERSEFYNAKCDLFSAGVIFYML